MEEREYVAILSDIHIGTEASTVWYRKEVHEKYLIAVLNEIIANANQIREVILLGDIFEFWAYPPDEIPPTLDDIIRTHPKILGTQGKFVQILSAVQGRVVYIPGDHDMNMTQEELNKIKSSDGYTIKYCPSAYIPEYDTDIIFTHGHEFTLLNAPYFESKVAPLPIGYFVNRAIAYKVKNILRDRPGDRPTRNVSFIKVTDSYQVNRLQYSNSTKKSFNNRDAFSSSITNIEEIATTTINKDFTFGWSVYNASWEYYIAMQLGVLSKAEELGIKVMTHNQESNTVEMITGCIELINKGIDALLISPYNPEGVPFIVSMAEKSKIPVVVIDGGTGGANVVAFIVSDSFGGGIYAGEYALILINKYSIKSKNVAIIKAEKTATYALLRGQGFERVMVDNGYDVVAEVSANGEENTAYEVVKLILSSDENDLAVIFCENGPMTLGAAQAIGEAGKKGIIMLIGFDADPSVIAGIEDESIQGTIAQQPYKMGQIGVEIANDALLGIPVIYDDPTKKLILMEVYLIDENGESRRNII